MPVIKILKSRLERLYPNRDYNEIISMLPYIGLDIEELADDYVRVEYSPNRPDFSTDVGIVKALKGLFGDELGAPARSLEDGSVEVFVDPSVIPVRPYIAAFAVNGLSLDEEEIRQLISMQEDLHHGVGRDRRKVAIGLHRLDAVRPPITYRAVGSEHVFLPLNSDAEMSVAEVLERTEQGRVYGQLVGKGPYPALVDSAGLTLSIPPIINCDQTRLMPGTQGLFIDITGTDLKSVGVAASVIAETLWEMKAKVIKGIIKYPDGKTAEYPELGERVMRITTDQISKLLGIELKPEEAVLAIRKSRLDAKAEGLEIYVSVPPYRPDIMHPVDLVEEAMIGYGLFNIRPDTSMNIRIGSPARWAMVEDEIRDAMVGLGFTETYSYSLTSKDVLSMAGKRNPDVYSVSFTRSSEHESLRDMLLPGCLEALSINQDEPMPHMLFEVGRAFAQGPKEERRLCALMQKDRATITDIRSPLDQLFRLIRGELPSYGETVRPYAARAAEVLIKGHAVGEVGEIHPAVLEGFKLSVPVVYFELLVEEAFKL